MASNAISRHFSYFFYGQTDGELIIRGEFNTLFFMRNWLAFSVSALDVGIKKRRLLFFISASSRPDPSRYFFLMEYFQFFFLFLDIWAVVKYDFNSLAIFFSSYVCFLFSGNHQIFVCLHYPIQGNIVYLRSLFLPGTRNELKFGFSTEAS